MYSLAVVCPSYDSVVSFCPCYFCEALPKLVHHEALPKLVQLDELALALHCADFIPSTLQCCTIEVYRLLYTSIYYKLLWLYNLFVRDPAPYKCSDQTRTICVNTKAERHVVAKSGDNTIPLPFKRTLSPYFRNLPLLHITIRLHLIWRLLKFMQWLARKQYLLRRRTRQIGLNAVGRVKVGDNIIDL